MSDWSSVKVCSECNGPHYAKGFCTKHYFKSRRQTTRTKYAEGSECISEGCKRRPRARGLCASHYNVAMGYSNGGGRRGRTKSKVVGYRAAHIRVEQAKGKASSHRCIDCGGSANEWSLSINSTDILVEYTNQYNRTYSLNIDDYEARCFACHRLLDGNAWWS